MADLLREWGQPLGIDVLLPALDAASHEVRTAAAAALRSLAQARGLDGAPPGEGQAAWVRWWLRHCIAGRGAVGESGPVMPAILSPGGVRYGVSPGAKIAPAAIVQRIKEEDGRFAIMVQLAGRTYTVRERSGFR